MFYHSIEYAVMALEVFLRQLRKPVHDEAGPEAGQATPEYALVILAAVALAATLIVWAKKSGAIAELFEFVIGKVKEAADK